MAGLIRSFRYALRGIALALGGRNFRIMACAACYVVWAGLIVQPTAAEWAAQLACCGLVLALEGMNTALEQLCDRVTLDRDPRIAAAKDCAAGAVLLASLFSAAVWLAVNGGRWALLAGWLTRSPWHGGLFAASVVLALAWSLAGGGSKQKDDK